MFFDSLVRIPLFHQAVNRYFNFYIFSTVSVGVQGQQAPNRVIAVIFSVIFSQRTF